MEFLGIIDEITDKKIVVICTSDVPDLGNPVFDSNNKKIGSIKRIFGPVEEPYISVAIDDGTAVKVKKGGELYTTRRAHNGKDKRRYRRD